MSNRLQEGIGRELRRTSAVILAGGLGTRLRNVIGSHAKVMAEVAGRPFITYLLDRLVTLGFREAVLATGFAAHEIMTKLGDRYRSLHLYYSIEDEPLGTGGALRYALPFVHHPHVLVLNGDSYTSADLRAFVEWHRAKEARCSLLLTRKPDAREYGRVDVSASGLVTGFHEKGTFSEPSWVNAGVYLFERSLVAELPSGESLSLERDLFPALASHCLYGHKSGGTFLDMGTPERLAVAQRYFAIRGDDSRQEVIHGH